MDYVLLFDIDGTLVDADRAGQEAMRRVLTRDFETPEAADAEVPSAGRTDAAIIAELFSDYGLPVSRLEEFVELYLKELRRVLPLRQSRLLPGATSILRRAEMLKGVSSGLLTGNLRVAADIKLGHHGVDGFFNFGAFGDTEVEREAVAADAARQLQLMGGPSADRVWVIGDTPADIRCARSVGFKAFAVASGSYDRETLAACEPDILADSLFELDPVLDSFS